MVSSRKGGTASRIKGCFFRLWKQCVADELTDLRLFPAKHKKIVSELHIAKNQFVALKIFWRVAKSSRFHVRKRKLRYSAKESKVGNHIKRSQNLCQDSLRRFRTAPVDAFVIAALRPAGKCRFSIDADIVNIQVSFRKVKNCIAQKVGNASLFPKSVPCLRFYMPICIVSTWNLLQLRQPPPLSSDNFMYPARKSSAFLLLVRTETKFHNILWWL